MALSIWSIKSLLHYYRQENRLVLVLGHVNLNVSNNPSPRILPREYYEFWEAWLVLWAVTPRQVAHIFLHTIGVYEREGECTSTTSTLV